MLTVQLNEPALAEVVDDADREYHPECWRHAPRAAPADRLLAARGGQLAHAAPAGRQAKEFGEGG